MHLFFSQFNFVRKAGNNENRVQVRIVSSLLSTSWLFPMNRKKKELFLLFVLELWSKILPLLSSNIGFEIQWSERNNRRTKSIGAGGGGGRFSFLNFRPSETGTNSSGLISALPRRTSSWETWKGKISSLSHVRMKPIFRIRSFLRIFLWEYVWGRISWFSCAEEEFKVYFILFGICRYLICNFCRRRRRIVFPPLKPLWFPKNFCFMIFSWIKW